MMRTIAFGYSSRCNLKCGHCVAADGVADTAKMELEEAKEAIAELAGARVQGLSFTAGEPLLYAEDLGALIGLCHGFGIYTRVVTNSFWAKTEDDADAVVSKLVGHGLSQLRLSYSRWHQQGVPRQYILNAARSCVRHDLDYFISFVTDFTENDDEYEQFLREHQLRFFPEPVIFAGRAKDFTRTTLHTDYQANCCAMNPYLSPSFDLYACCDAGSQFTETNVFHLGNIRQTPVAELLSRSEANPLYNHIRNLGISGLASFAGFTAREIVGYRKCELCEKLFNNPQRLSRLEQQVDTGLRRCYR